MPEGSACRQPFCGAYSAKQPATNLLCELMDDTTHARGLPPSRTGAPRTGAQNHFREHQGVPPSSRGAGSGRHLALAGRDLPPRLRALVCRGRRPRSRRRSSSGSSSSTSRRRRKAPRAKRGSAPSSACSTTGTRPPRGGLRGLSASKRTRYLGTAADLTVAMILAFGSAAAGSRLLWPVLLIAAYYAAGVLLTGTTPMVALLGSTASSSDPTGPQRQPDRRRYARRRRSAARPFVRELDVLTLAPVVRVFLTKGVLP